MANDKRPAYKRYNHLYDHIDNDGICVYCGARAKCLDHFAPLSAVHSYESFGIDVSGKYTVPACSECNSLAGHRRFNTIAEKRNYIRAKLEDRYADLLKMPEWTDSDLSELGYNLRTFVRAGQEERRWIQQRLRWTNLDNPAAAQIAAIRSRLSDAPRSSALNSAGMKTTEKPISR